jgi:hypothetical protein
MYYRNIWGGVPIFRSGACMYGSRTRGLMGSWAHGILGSWALGLMGSWLNGLSLYDFNVTCQCSAVMKKRHRQRGNIRGNFSAIMERQCK